MNTAQDALNLYCDRHNALELRHFAARYCPQADAAVIEWGLDQGANTFTLFVQDVRFLKGEAVVLEELTGDEAGSEQSQDRFVLAKAAPSGPRRETMRAELFSGDQLERSFSLLGPDPAPLELSRWLQVHARTYATTPLETPRVSQDFARACWEALGPPEKAALPLSSPDLLESEISPELLSATTLSAWEVLEQAAVQLLCAEIAALPDPLTRVKLDSTTYSLSHRYLFCFRYLW